ncbi:hypothetical protein V866_002501 [Kwoniella sp. B9012]
MSTGQSGLSTSAQSASVEQTTSEQQSTSAAQLKMSRKNITEEKGDNVRWTLESQLKEDQELLRSRGLPPYKSLSLAYDHLSVRGTGGIDNVEYGKSLGTYLLPWQTLKYRRKVELSSSTKKSDKMPTFNGDKEASEAHTPTRDGDRMVWSKGDPIPSKGQEGLRKGEHYLIKDFSGLVKSGEMMLVIGRPGSGCTTFLKALSGNKEGYAGLDGTVYYGSLDSKKNPKDLEPIKSDIIFNSEEDLHDPNLLVGRTLDFALRMNTPSSGTRLPKEMGGDPMSRKEYQDKSKKELLKMFGLEHTHDTKVGDQYVRGVSGGEKKRVSIAEVLTSKASIQMWDNATRGLDADSALRFIKNLRTFTDIERHTMVVSLYQAGNGIYNLFDKVTVIAEGRIIYYGPRSEARKYFEDLGFVHPDGGNTADFLTAVTATNERKIKPGYTGHIPTTASEFAAIYVRSSVAQLMRQELDAYLSSNEKDVETENTRSIIQHQKDKWARKVRPEKVNYVAQVKAALIRDYQQRWGDQWTFWVRPATMVAQALIGGSMFYQMPEDTSGLFLRGGVLFLTLFFPSLMSLGETTAVFTGRSVLAKHKGFSMYRPSAVLFAKTIGDLPIFAIQIFLFAIIIYFMTGLQVDAGLFFAFLLFTYMTTLCTTALFRFIGYSFNTFNNASKASGFAILLLSLYAGYAIYTPAMHPWFGWIRWINVFYYAFEAMMINELDGLSLACVSPQLAPTGGTYDQLTQGCAVAGSSPGSTIVSGRDWAAVALRFYKNHVWRNFGIITAMWIFFLALCAIMIELLPAAGTTKSMLLYKRGGGGRFIREAKKNGSSPKDEEDGPSHTQLYDKSAHSSEGQVGNGEVHAVNSVLTWRNLNYTVNANGKPKKLLDNISGYCKAGTLTALMGSSGAGKTTLMDVLALRKTEGEIEGQVLMNGRPLSVSFQRTTGYCEQVDVHLPQATVREALEFSALLRQPRTLTNKEKLSYVDVIIELLELRDIEDALIGTPGNGLDVEQRKRLTIGVELVSKPTLLFLDEPTSGLDGQSSYLIVSFLRKLAAAGQAVLCTIHQPSAALFARFDQLLLLKGGGKTVYFGAIDEMNSYFERNGVSMPKEINPAERMIDIVSGDLSQGRDWAQIWLDSQEFKDRLDELEELKEDSSKVDIQIEGEHYEYASPAWLQLKLVSKRASIQLWRDTEYVFNKIALHVAAALLNGFSFWKIGNTYADLQNRVFSTFMYVFVAPGVIHQTQPKFIHNRDIFEAREKKAKLYAWWAFCFGEIVAEIPYLLICALLYFAPWYPTAGLSFKPGVAGPVYLQMTFYEFLYTGIGQFIAAYSPHEVFASLVNPLLIGILIMFCGVLVPYSQITAFWRYWLYYLNPFNYLMGGLVSRILWDVEVRCAEDEFGVFDPPPGSGMTCGEYMTQFLAKAPGYLNNPEATSGCQYCTVAKGSSALEALGLGEKSDGWRDIAITFLFCLSSYALVFLLLKLRSKQSKKAK